MIGPTSDEWEQTVDGLERLERRIRRSDAINVNALALRTTARELSLTYFQRTRQTLLATGIQASLVDALNAEFQQLLRLANGKLPKVSYLRTFQSLRELRVEVDTERVVRFTSGPDQIAVLPALDDAISRTLDELVPTAGNSYRQAIRDLQDDGRISWRGPAVELRESLRETLDHLAPDDTVKTAKGYKEEANRDRPTMSQKIRFILKSRNVASGGVDAPADTASAVEGMVAALGRSIYTRGAIDTHVASTRTEVRQLKRYVDAVLCDILAIS